MHPEQAIALRIWFKQTYLSENAQSFRVSAFYGKVGDKNFPLVEKGEKSCLRFFGTVKKSYLLRPHDNKDQIRNRYPLFREEIACWNDIWVSDNKNSKCKVLRNLRTCAFDYF